MLTRDQAIEAAFYTGANLLSFTDERADNLDWMGVDREDLARAKRTAGFVALANTGVARGAATSEDAIHGISNLALMVRSHLVVCGLLTVDLSAAQIASYYAFVSVLLAFDQLMTLQARDAEMARVAAAPVPTAAALLEDEEQRIDRRNPDPLALVEGIPLAAPAAKPKAKGKA